MVNTPSEYAETSGEPLLIGRDDTGLIENDSNVIQPFLRLEPLYAESIGLVDYVLDQQSVQKHLSILKAHDRGSYDHSLKIGQISADIGKEFGLDEKELILLTQGALLHDIGKIDVPSNILEKAYALSSEEKEILMQHPGFGYQRLKDTDGILKYMVLIHHRYKKRSYPDIDSFETDINIERLDKYTQIISVSDILDALLDGRGGSRQYKRRHSLQSLVRTIYDEFTGDRDLITHGLLRISHGDQIIH